MAAVGEWVTSDEPAWPAIINEDLWMRVNARITNTRGPQRRRPRAEPGKYLLTGMLLGLRALPARRHAHKLAPLA